MRGQNSRIMQALGQDPQKVQRTKVQGMAENAKMMEHHNPDKRAEVMVGRREMQGEQLDNERGQMGVEVEEEEVL